METISDETLDGDQAGSAPPAPGRVSFLRAAAGFILEDSVDRGVIDPEAGPEPRAEIVDPVDSPTVAVPTPSRMATPAAHRLMLFAFVPFLVIAIGGMAMITFSSSPRPQPVARPRVATTPDASIAPPVPPPAPTTTVAPPRFVAAPVPPPVPTTRAPRLTPTTTAPVASTVPVTDTTLPPAPSTADQPLTVEEPTTTTTTTEPPPTTTTTQPPTTTTTQPPPPGE